MHPKTMPPNVMMQACPVAQLFEGVRLVQNGQTIENKHRTAPARWLTCTPSTHQRAIPAVAALTSRRGHAASCRQRRDSYDGLEVVSEFGKQADPGNVTRERRRWISSKWRTTVARHTAWAPRCCERLSAVLTVNQHWSDDLFHSRNLCTKSGRGRR